MATDAEIRAKFWAALKSDMTMFLGLAEGEDGHARPMTAQLEEDGWDGDTYRGPIWFFTSTDNDLFKQIGDSGGINSSGAQDGIPGSHAHGIPASGTTGAAIEPGAINAASVGIAGSSAGGLGSGGDARAMAHFVSKGHDIWATLHGNLSTSQDRTTIDRLWNRFVAAWYDGKDDPKVALIRLDPEQAQIWIDASSVVAGIKMFLGIDTKQDYKDKVAEVTL